MGKDQYTQLLKGNPHILQDEIDTEFTATYVKSAKKIVEQDSCEKRTEIRKTIAKYKNSVNEILGKKMEEKKKAREIDHVIQDALDILNEKKIFSSTCSDEYQTPFLKEGHILTHCPGDTARDQLLKYFIAKIEECWQGTSSSGKKVTVLVEHSDGLCAHHHDMYY